MSKKSKVVILDDNILSLTSYCEDYPENAKKLGLIPDKDSRPKGEPNG